MLIRGTADRAKEGIYREAGNVTEQHGRNRDMFSHCIDTNREVTSACNLPSTYLHPAPSAPLLRGPMNCHLLHFVSRAEAITNSPHQPNGRRSNALHNAPHHSFNSTR